MLRRALAITALLATAAALQPSAAAADQPPNTATPPASAPYTATAPVGAQSPTPESSATPPVRPTDPAGPSDPTASASADRPGADPTDSADPTTPAEPTTPTEPSTTTPGPTTPAQPTTAAALAISLDQPATTWEDRPLTFTGQLSNGATNWYISLWQALPSGWVLRGATQSTAGGAYRITYTPTTAIHTTFRTVIGPKFYGAPAISPARIGTAQDRRIVVNKPAASYVTLTGVAVTGATVPAEPGREVVLQDLLGSGQWRWLTSVKADAKGNFRLPVPDNFPSSRTVRVVSRGVPAPEVEVSPTAWIVIKAGLNAKVYAVAPSMVPKTYRAGCPVAPGSLRLLTMNHWGLDGLVHKGELIVRDAAVQKMISVWSQSFSAKFPIRRMWRVDVYGGNDVTAMEADNTSVFNCRQVTGNPYALSPHSYGYAIDINTVENPYLAANNVWYPKNGLAYRDRSTVRPGMLFTGSTPTKALIAQGYFWGARWSKPDYQHFEPK
ncbi:D-alanyl-D-alanine carboxypeptidase-like protein [Kribbella amoyensis]|uniref:D-alanyl-D-alanine carboxypeptidase-like protein n=1 Tax=Kribbella amoyensis TaxID=996641 RepID=A0A561BU76_9ACTN|nr:M15 family metallopeptidase [Kribbella amoyensis]TWD82417.1 D-alanyl-D-alanine carboxypeptidase-like protein [Kribbella amoyensis]